MRLLLAYVLYSPPGLIVVGLTIAAGRAFSVEVLLKDGRLLTGRLGEVSGLSDVPATGQADSGGRPLRVGCYAVRIVDEPATIFHRRHRYAGKEHDAAIARRAAF